MNQGSFSDFAIEGWMDWVEDQPKHFAAFYADPFGVADFSTLEIIGGSYARQPSTWLRTDVRALTLDSPVVFRSLVPGTSIAAIGVVTDPFAGEIICRTMLLDVNGDPQPISYPSGGSYAIASGEYVIGVDIPTSP